MVIKESIITPVNTEYEVLDEGVKVTINETVNGKVNTFKTFTILVPRSVIVEAHDKYLKPLCKCTDCPNC